MAKKTSKRSSSRKSVSRSSKKSFKHVLIPVSFKRIILITTCLALFVFIGTVLNDQGRQSVAGINITKGLFAQATITLPQVENAVSFNLYYKKENESEYINSVRDIPVNVSTYTVSYLTKGAKYIYKVAAVDASGGEFWSEEKNLADLKPM